MSRRVAALVIAGFVLAVTVLGGCFPDRRQGFAVFIANETSRTVGFLAGPRDAFIADQQWRRSTLWLTNGEASSVSVYREATQGNCNERFLLEAVVDEVVVASVGPGVCFDETLTVTDEDLLRAGVDVLGEANPLTAVVAAQALGPEDWEPGREFDDPDIAIVLALEYDFAQGSISADEYAVYGVFRWFEPERVPEVYRLPAREWTQLGELRDALTVTLRVWPDLSEESRREIEDLFPTLPGVLWDALPGPSPT